MSLEQALQDRLAADAGVAALVSTRIYPDVLPPRPTYPAVKYQRISTVRLYNLSGKADQATPRMQIDCYATTRLQAIAVADAVRDALGDGGTDWGATHVRRVSVENEVADLEPTPEPKIYNQRLDFFIVHTEA